MPQNVEVSVKTQLDKITKQLEDIQRASEATERGIKSTAVQVDTSVNQSMQKTQQGIDKTGSQMRRTLLQMKNDLKALGAIGVLAGGLKLGAAVKDSVSDILSLTDAVRKYAAVLKITDQAKFIGNLSKGLDEVGMGADVAKEGIEGLSHTQVRGTDEMIKYLKTAGMLAGATNQKGKSGEIVQLLAGVNQARGIPVNDTKAMQALATQVLRSYEAGGGKSDSIQILTSMKDIFNSMATDFKKKLTPKAISQLEAISSAGGEGSASFIKDYLSTNSLSRSALRTMGYGNLFSEQGLNEKALSGIYGKGKASAINGDVAGGIVTATAGQINDEQARGLVRLYENIAQVNRASEEATKSTRTVEVAFDDAKTSGDAFVSVLDRVRNAFAGDIAAGDKFITKTLKDIQKSKTGSELTVGALAIGSALGGSAVFKWLKGLLPSFITGGGAAAAEGAAGLGVSSTGGIVGGGATAAGIGGGALALGGGAALLGGAVLGIALEKALDGSQFSKNLDKLIEILIKKSGVGVPEVGGPRQMPGKLDVNFRIDDRNKQFVPMPKGSVGPTWNGGK